MYNMQFREYTANDFAYIQDWIKDEKTHAMWCANLIPYPITLDGFTQVLEKDKNDWGGRAFIYENDENQPIGFLIYSVNQKDNSAFLKFVVMDYNLRGQGYGTQMVKQVLHQLFELEKVTLVKLNVFDCNAGAKKCYEKAGFVQKQDTPDAFMFQSEAWGRCFMVVENNKKKV